MAGIITINIVAPGALEISNDGAMHNSLPGHVWYSVTDSSGRTASYGFDPIKQGSPFGAGRVSR